MNEVCKTMTIKEIASLTGKTQRGICKRISDVSEKSSGLFGIKFQLQEKLNIAKKTKKPADFTLPETIEIIRAGGNAILADLLVDNAKRISSNAESQKIISADIKDIRNSEINDNSIISQLKNMHKVSGITIQAIENHEKRIKALEKNRLALPVPESVEDEYVLPTQLGKMVVPVISPQKVNSMLREKGFQYRAGGEWIPSDKGKAVSRIVPIQLDNGKMIYQLNWKRKIAKNFF